MVCRSAARWTVASLSLGIIVLGSLSVGCNNQPEWVIQPASSSQAPTFTVGNLNPKGIGKVEPGISTATGVVNTTPWAELQLVVTAANPVSGVKSLDLSIRLPGQTPVHTLHMDGTKNSAGEVPIYIRAVGTNGSGGPGNTPLEIKMTTPLLLEAKAVSFDGASSEISLWYWPWGAVTATLTADPPAITIGETTKLKWTTKFAQNGWIEPGMIGLTAESGEIPLMPTANTPYKVVATNPFGTATADAPVVVSMSGQLKVTYSGPQNSTVPVLPSAPTFTFHGDYVGSSTAPGSGATTFDRTVDKRFEWNQPWLVTDTFLTLRPGTWKVTVTASGQGSVTCKTVHVPGVLTVKPNSTQCPQ